MDYSASIAEIGRDAARDTWQAAINDSGEYSHLNTKEEIQAAKDYFSTFGAWEKAHARDDFNVAAAPLGRLLKTQFARAEKAGQRNRRKLRRRQLHAPVARHFVLSRRSHPRMHTMNTMLVQRHVMHTTSPDTLVHKESTSISQRCMRRF